MIRHVEEKDHEEVVTLIKGSFAESEHGYHGEAELVERLRLEASHCPEFEFVYEKENQLIAHCFLSEVTIIKNNKIQCKGLAVAPLCVLPHFQSQGIGSQLMQALETTISLGDYQFISILGDPNYYLRFGYQEAKNFSITPPFDISSEYFLIKPASSESLVKKSGVLTYLSPFNTNPQNRDH
ncbi:GNAT family N-acetyltransferase [Vagococcus sp.]|uniref:GNAT family N-acetyltransferase n=1 Tax=Vagococcus sp. TaxID=1933889 RepID=UPI003F96AF10